MIPTSSSAFNVLSLIRSFVVPDVEPIQVQRYVIKKKEIRGADGTSPLGPGEHSYSTLLLVQNQYSRCEYVFKGLGIKGEIIRLALSLYVTGCRVKHSQSN